MGLYLAWLVRLVGLCVVCSRLLHRCFGPELADEWSDERIDNGLQKAFVNPEEDRDDNAGDAHHDCSSNSH